MTLVKIARVASTNAVLRCRVAGGEPGEAALHPGSFVEMAPEVMTSPGTPIRHVDAVRSRDDGTATWISGHRLHGWPRRALEPLLNGLESALSEPGFLDPDDVEAFTAFLLAVDDDPASAGSSDGHGLGGVAVPLPDGGLLAIGSREARGRLERPATGGSSWADPATGTSSLPSPPPRRAGWSARGAAPAPRMSLPE